MSNRHVTEFIDDYLQGGMDHAGRAAVESHMSECAECRQSVEAARQSAALLRWLPHPDAPPQPGPDFYLRVQAAIESRQRRSWLLNWTSALQPRLALPAVMMGMLLLALLVVPRRGTAHTVQSAEGWEEVEFPAADFAAMSYSDDGDELRHDRMMNNLFDGADAQ